MELLAKIVNYFQGSEYASGIFLFRKYNAFNLSNEPASLTTFYQFLDPPLHTIQAQWHSRMFNGCFEKFHKVYRKKLKLGTFLSKVNLLRCQTLLAIFYFTFASTSVHFRGDFTTLVSWASKYSAMDHAKLGNL